MSSDASAPSAPAAHAPGRSSSARHVHTALFLTMMVWGLNLSAVKVLTASLDILLVACVRMVLAAGVLFAAGRVFGAAWPAWRGRTWGLGLLAAFLLVYCQQIAFAAGLARTSATNAALVMALGPMVSVLLEALLFRRVVRPAQIAGVLLALSGVALVILNRTGAALTEAAWGDLWILLSVAAFALGGTCVQKLARETPPLAISVFAHVAGALMLGVHVALGVPDPLGAVAAMGPWQWTLVAYSGLLATALGAVVWARGIAILGVGRTASYLSWLPVFGVLFGALALAEAVTVWHLLGAGAVLTGSFLSARR